MNIPYEYADDFEILKSSKNRKMFAALSPLEKAVIIIQYYIEYGGYGIYNTRNLCGDPMFVLYYDKDLRVEICYSWMYFEVFGLSIEDFNLLEQCYNEMIKR